MQDFIEGAQGPVFAVCGHNPSEGAVAAVSVNYEHLGAVMGAQAAAVFRAGNASAVPVMASHAFHTVWDWWQMERWKLDEKLPPPGSEVRFRPPGLWEEHRGTMAAITAIITGLVGVVAVLLV